MDLAFLTSSPEGSLSTGALLCVALVILPLLLWTKIPPYPQPSTKKTRSCESVPPTVPGELPWLGHALAYKKDPIGFLRKCEQTVGPVFRINLAGRRLLVVTGGGGDDDDRSLVRFVARQPDERLSLRQAVEEFGFCYILGRR